jgi:hypothetical protein
MTDRSSTQPAEDFGWSDGNALAGPLAEVFAIDITVTNGQCAGCGRTGPLAQARVFGGSHGLVARCPGCDAVLLHFVRSPARCWLGLSGLRYLEVPAMPAAADDE